MGNPNKIAINKSHGSNSFFDFFNGNYPTWMVANHVLFYREAGWKFLITRNTAILQWVLSTSTSIIPFIILLFRIAKAILIKYHKWVSNGQAIESQNFVTLSNRTEGPYLL